MGRFAIRDALSHIGSDPGYGGHFPADDRDSRCTFDSYASHFDFKTGAYQLFCSFDNGCID